MNSISVSSWLKKMILLLIIPLIVVMRFLSWNKIYAGKIYFAYQETQTSFLGLDASSLSPFGRVMFFLFESVPALCLLGALCYFLILIELYKNNLFFSQKAVTLLKKIAGISLFWALYALLFPTIGSLLISAFKPAGQRCITLAISHENVAYFFLALVLFLILQVIQAAYKIKTEQDLVV